MEERGDGVEMVERLKGRGRVRSSKQMLPIPAHNTSD